MRFLLRAEAKIQKPNNCLTLIDGVYYAIGSYIETECDCPCIITKETEQFEIKESTLAIKMPESIFYMALDAKGGKGGDLVGNNKILIWNGEMMNCSLLELEEDGSIFDYEIDLDNCDFENMEVLGIQK